MTFQNLTNILIGDSPPRVWSLLVTAFSELAQDEGAAVSGALLGTLTSLMGVKPEAMRVALHRLRKDGWIDSTRDGRTRAHALTDWGRAQCAAATPRIYATTPSADTAWLAVCDPSEPTSKLANKGTWLTSNIAITHDPAPFGAALTTALNAPLPAWMHNKLIKPETLSHAKAFGAQLASLEKALRKSPPLTPLETSALRVLIVHGWRRIILRTPPLPDDIFPSNWSGPKCRNTVAALLATHPHQPLASLEAALA